MDEMNIFSVIFILGVVPVALEVLVDKAFWLHGKNDKPWSTIIRAVIFALLAFAFHADGLAYWWQALIFTFTWHTLLFDYVLNKSRGKKFFYISESDHWYERISRKFGWQIMLFFKLWLALVGYGVYFHLDWIV